MKLNNQKRWGKVWSAAAGLIIYNAFTAVSYSADNWQFPNGAVFKESGKIVWEGEIINRKEVPYYSGFASDVIHGKVISTVSNSYWGVVDGYHGVVLEPGIILTFSGKSNASTRGYNVLVEYQYKGEPKASSTQNDVYINKDSWIYKYEAILDRNNTQDRISGDNTYRATNLQVALYISDSVKPNTYSYSGDVNLEVGNMRVYLNNHLTFKVAPPIQCTINTPPKIDFGKVNIWDWKGNTSGTPGGNRKDVLGVVDGNFTINCTGDNGAHTPAKLTLKGTIQTYTNDLKMTMDATGDLAPATVRASIKSIFAPCNNGGTQFGPGTKTPPGNEVDLGELTVGPHQVPYRFSLCALGQGFKSGAASATATVTIDWE
ncbi:hypothetical protein [Providencia sp. wls1921]|uniref:hypothetical protein n=1 Tax=Providencia sp. wls1921 TaxID=2675153 RepID=UPI001E59FDDA|nr:hypothetical protein [Providencia sp. wls1921]